MNFFLPETDFCDKFIESFQIYCKMTDGADAQQLNISAKPSKRRWQQPYPGLHCTWSGREWLHHLDKRLGAYSHSQNFFARPFLCSFCVFEDLQIKTAVDDWSPILEANSTEQYWRSDHVPIFGVHEDVFAKVVRRAEKAGVKLLLMMLVVRVTVYRVDVEAQNL